MNRNQPPIKYQLIMSGFAYAGENELDEISMETSFPLSSSGGTAGASGFGCDDDTSDRYCNFGSTGSSHYEFDPLSTNNTCEDAIDIFVDQKARRDEEGNAGKLPSPIKTSTPYFSNSLQVLPSRTRNLPETMTLAEFAKETEQTIYDTVTESIGLFERDPRTYHPFYLRIFKYITIGQRLGCITKEESQVNSIWAGFFKFSKSQFEMSKTTPILFTGERSAYATYLLTKKLVVNGKSITQTQNKAERLRIFKKVETAAKRIRKEWDQTALAGDDICDDLKTNLMFIKECTVVTHPADCFKMNNLWAKFLSQEGFSKRTCLGGVTNKSTHTSGAMPNSSVGSEISLVSVAPEIAANTVHQHQLQNGDNNDEESRKILNKFILETIVVPYLGNRSLCTVPTAKPMGLPDLVISSHASPTKTAITPKQGLKIKQARVSVVSPKKTKRYTMSRGKMQRKIIDAKEKSQTIARIIKKNKRLFPGLTIHKPRTIINNGVRISRQLQLEKIINKPDNKLISAVSKRKKKNDNDIIVDRKQGIKEASRDSLSLSSTKNFSSFCRISPLTKSSSAKQQKRKRSTFVSQRRNDRGEKQKKKLETKFVSPPLSSPSSSEKELISDQNSTLSTNVVCDKCGKDILSTYITIHKESMHNPERSKGVCPVCQKLFAEPRSLWYHYCEYHITGSPLENFEPLLKNREIISQEEDIRIAQSLSKNEPAMTDISATCEHCGKCFANKHSLSRHIRQFHVTTEQIQSENSFKCPHCDKQFKQKDWLAFHVKQKHEGTIKSKCEHCGKHLQTAGKLWRHLIDTHSVSAFDAASYCDITFIPCTYCGQELLEGRQLINHMKSQHPDHFEEFSLALIAQKQSNLKQKQARQKEQNTPYYTEEVREYRKLKKREERRLFKEKGIGPAWVKKENNGEQNGTCSECGHYFKRLKMHMKTVHGIMIGNRPYLPCPVNGCMAKLATKPSLKTHLREYHTATIDEAIIKRKIVKVIEETENCIVHLCTLCETYLYHYEEMKVHIVATHPEIFADLLSSAALQPPPPTEIRCPHCTLQFNSDKQVRCHVEESHQELCWRCPDCSKVLLSPEDLDQHFMEDHIEKRITRLDEEQYEKVKSDETSDDENTGTLKKVKRKHKKMSASSKLGVPNRKAMESLRLRDSARSKFAKIVVQCEICKCNRTLGSLTAHIKRVHELKENSPLICSKCPIPVVYDVTKDKSRANFLLHMDRHHGRDINMEELIEMAGKVRTRCDWKMLKVKNDGLPKQAKGKRKPLVRKKPSPKCKASSNDNSNEVEDSQIKSQPAGLVSRKGISYSKDSDTIKRKNAVQRARKNKRANNENKSKNKIGLSRVKAEQPLTPVRISGRNRRKPGKFAGFFIDAVDERECENDLEDEKNREDDFTHPDYSKRTLMVPSVEREKKLVIKLARLTEEELIDHFLRQNSVGKDVKSVNSDSINLKTEVEEGSIIDDDDKGINDDGLSI